MELLTIKQASALSTISRSKLYEILAKDEIPVYKFGRSRRIAKDDLILFCERHRQTYSTEIPFGSQNT
jgi:excisionase family DNA binding protein